MLDTILIGGISGAGLVVLIAGMANVIKVFNKKKGDKIGFIESMKAILGRSIVAWSTSLFFILFILLTAFGIITSILLGN